MLINLLGRWGQLGVEQSHSGAGFVDQIDCLVRKEPVGDVAITKGGSGNESFIRDLESVMLLIALTQTTKNFDGVVDGRLTHIHGLEATLKSGVPFDVFAVFVQCCGSDALEFTPRQSGLENIGGINGALCGTGTDQGVNLIDHQDHVSCGLDLLHDLFEPLFELTPIFGAGNQKTDIEREHTLVFKNVRNVTLLNPLGQALCDRGFTNTGFSD